MYCSYCGKDMPCGNKECEEKINYCTTNYYANCISCGETFVNNRHVNFCNHCGYDFNTEEE